jgi:hydrogenase maturation protease
LHHTSAKLLVVGIGNVLMGDEGVGVHAVRRLESQTVPVGVELLDGGTGGLHLLDHMQSADSVVLIDATADGLRPGTVRRLRPRFSADYPRTLTAHDIGLKDLLDAMYLLGAPPEITLITVSIELPLEVGIGLSEEIAAALPEVTECVLAEVTRLRSRR